jgi:hypothetical protein
VLAAAAEPLPKLAARLMAELFGSEYHPGEWVDLNAAAGPLIPPNSGSKLGDPIPDGVRILARLRPSVRRALRRCGVIISLDAAPCRDESRDRARANRPPESFINGLVLTLKGLTLAR